MQSTANTSLQGIRQSLINIVGPDKGQNLFEVGMGLPSGEQRKDFFEGTLKDCLERRKTGKSSTLRKLIQQPRPKGVVDIQTFLYDRFYLGLSGQVYPEVMKEIKEINSGRYVEIVLTGAIGTAKTTIALWSTAYQLYLISRMKNPQATFGLDRAAEILFIFQSINAGLAQKLDYARFRELVQHSPYFNKVFPFRRDLESELQFPNRIIARPVTGAETAAIGQNVIGGIIDELNYMAVIENSKAAVDGGVYDQAVALYNSIARRRKSRFMTQGKMPGLLCLVSSKRYPGQFTDQKEEEAQTDKTIYVYNKRVWDIKPDSFSGEWFNVFIGTPTRKPRILEDDAPIPVADRELVMAIPEEYRHEFKTDIMNALREVAGVSTLARHPYIMDADAITDMMEDYKSIFMSEWTDYDTNPLKVNPKAFVHIDEPRFAHLDLSLSGDSTGLVIGHLEGFESLRRDTDTEYLPKIRIDGAIEIRPPRGGEIIYSKIRDTLYKLRELGLPIKWVTFDSFQSVDSIQVLRSKGFTTGNQSLDTTIAPYEILKSAIYDRRIKCPVNETLQKELVSLEFIADKGKVDHPPNGSKDIADALAGVAYGLTMRRELWGRFGVSPLQAPTTILETIKKARLEREAATKKKAVGES